MRKSPRLPSSKRRVLSSRLVVSRKKNATSATSDSEFTRIREKALAHLESGGAENRMPHANQLWMLVGFELFSRLGEQFECREVFPQAIVSVLGAADEHKTASKGYEAQLRAAAAALTRQPATCP